MQITDKQIEINRNKWQLAKHKYNAEGGHMAHKFDKVNPSKIT